MEIARRALYVFGRPPKAELISTIIDDVGVGGSANGHHSLRGVPDGQVLCESPAFNSILASLLSSKAIVDVRRRVGSVVLGL